MKVNDIPVRTGERYEFVSITDEVRRIVREAGVEEGVCVVFSTRDLAAAGKALMASLDVRFEHAEGNSDSHFLTGLFGQSQHLLVRGGNLDLGRWQGVFLAEFDGPRSRTVRVAVY
jgi:thiamine phosphate synthase YjbQ (UPF0047 family)